MHLCITLDNYRTKVIQDFVIYLNYMHKLIPQK
jgi:hypothetical protein